MFSSSWSFHSSASLSVSQPHIAWSLLPKIADLDRTIHRTRDFLFLSFRLTFSFLSLLIAYNFEAGFQLLSKTQQILQLAKVLVKVKRNFHMLVFCIFLLASSPYKLSKILSNVSTFLYFLALS